MYKYKLSKWFYSSVITSSSYGVEMTSGESIKIPATRNKWQQKVSRNRVHRTSSYDSTYR